MNQPTTKEELLQSLREMTPKSGEMWESAQEFVPGGLLSLARKFEPYPFYTHRAEGPYIWDVDENQYIDCCMSYGVIFLGHRPPEIMNALSEQETLGLTYGTPHSLEIAFAERFLECVPCADRMLLCNSGTEATMQAIRIMRAYTGRDKIGKFEGTYHGWHDYASWSTNVIEDRAGPAKKPIPIPESAGIPQAVEDTVLLLPFEEAAFEMIEEHADELAGVMIEPVIGAGKTIPVSKEFLSRLREVTDRTGVLLMFDEVITGFRMALGGAQEYHGILPDLATYGKILGGGTPIGAVGCSKSLMDTVLEGDMSLAIAGTFSGNPLTLAAGHALLGYLMENQNIYEEVEARGDRLREDFNDWAQSNSYPATMTGSTSMFQIHLKEPPINKPRDLWGENIPALRDLQLYLRLNGLFVPWLHLSFFSAAHNDAIMDVMLEIQKTCVEASLRANGVI